MPVVLACAGVLAGPVSPASAEDAVDYTLTSWTTRDGLPSSYLLSIAQDRDGYLWVGTNAGVVRFDGQRFSPWPRSGAYPVPSTLINAIFATGDGAVWVAAGDSIVREKAGELTVLPSVGGVSQVANVAGTVWAGGSGGLVRLTGHGWQPVPLPDAGRVRVTAVHEDRRHRLWVATSDRVYRQEGTGFVRLPVDLNGPARFFEHDGVLFVGSVASDFRIFRLNDAGDATPVLTMPLVDLQEPSNWSQPSWRVTTTPWLLDSRGNAWIGTNGAGLLRIEPGSQRVVRRYTERDGLSGDMVRAVTEDRHGNIWVATHSGLTRVTPASIRSVPVRAGSTADDISTIEQDAAGGVWVEAPGALVRLADGASTRFTSGAGAQFDRITAMHTDARGVLWVAAADRRLVRWNRGRFEAVPLPAAFAASAIESIASGADGHLWLYNGREILRQAPDGTQVFVTPPDGITDGVVRFTYADRRGRLWIAADRAEIAIVERTGVRMLGAADGVPPGNLTGIHEDASGRIWMSSDSGLSAIDGAIEAAPGGTVVRTLTAANGIPGRRVFFVTDDAQGRLWLGTTSGLARVEKAELDRALADPHYQIRLQLFDVSDGLRGTPVVRGYPTAVRSRDRIWFVSSTGVATVNPAQVRDALPPPVPRIEQILVDGRPFDPASGDPLPAGMASLQIEHAALNLTAPTKVRFRHRLEGVDPDWVDDGGTTRTVYAHLPDGTYRFVVAASAGDGRWSGAPAVWTFVVPPQWYQSRLFYGAAAALVMLGVWAAWQLRLRQVHRRFTDVLGERARVAREIHDTLLQSLVGMALQLDTVAHTEEPSGIREEVGRIRRQVQDAIGEAQRSIRDLRAPRAEARDLITRLRESAGPMLEHAGITFELVVTGTPRPLKPAVEQQLMRIGMEAVVNAMRHAQPAHVRMEVVFERSTVRLRVSDDGHGFNPDAVRADASGHWGLSIMRERAEQVGGRLSIMSTPERGTSIEVTAPGGAPA
ncbi:MAG: two-component regulator propeller domain-containing protein [Vicinamibacterales bacterium]